MVFHVLQQSVAFYLILLVEVMYLLFKCLLQQLLDSAFALVNLCEQLSTLLVFKFVAFAHCGREFFLDLDELRVGLVSLDVFGDCEKWHRQSS